MSDYWIKLWLVSGEPVKERQTRTGKWGKGHAAPVWKGLWGALPFTTFPAWSKIDPSASLASTANRADDLLLGLCCLKQPEVW